jgi:hypothetical protein
VVIRIELRKVATGGVGECAHQFFVSDIEAVSARRDLDGAALRQFLPCADCDWRRVRVPSHDLMIINGHAFRFLLLTVSPAGRIYQESISGS